VDDNSTSNFLHELLLTKLGLTEHIAVAENGAEALALLARAYAAPASTPYPALILLDVNMPVMGQRSNTAHHDGTRRRVAEVAAVGRSRAGQ
jgi:CheY-like chemotaxis protein